MNCSLQQLRKILSGIHIVAKHKEGWAGDLEKVTVLVPDTWSHCLINHVSTSRTFLMEFSLYGGH